MFKRPKDDSTSETTESSMQSATTSKPTYQNADHPSTGQTAQSSETPSTRVVTPAYEVRRPAVRTLQSSTPSTASSNAPAANLHVGRGLKLEGKIQSCDVLVIEGDVQATIESGTLNISESGDVRGEATVDQAEINGKFDGSLTVRKCLTINASGRVTGTIRYGELKIEQGGKLSGEIEATETNATSSASRPGIKSDIASSPSALA